MKFSARFSECVACGSDRIAFWRSKAFAYSSGDTDVLFAISKCRECGTGFLNPPPAPEALREIYATSGHGLQSPISLTAVLDAETRAPGATLDARRMAEGSRGRVAEHIGLKALDVGSGYGFQTRALADVGFEVTAINPASFENAVFEELNGCAPLSVMLEDYQPDGQFAVVLMSQVLEHIVKPAAALSHVRGIMAPGGILVIAVPNFASLAVRLLGTRDNGCLWVPEHVNYFTRPGLEALLDRSGFTPDGVEWVTRVPSDFLSRRIRSFPETVSRSIVRLGQVPLDMIANPSGLARYLTIYARAS